MTFFDKDKAENNLALHKKKNISNNDGTKCIYYRSRIILLS